MICTSFSSTKYIFDFFPRVHVTLTLWYTMEYDPREKNFHGNLALTEYNRYSKYELSTINQKKVMAVSAKGGQLTPPFFLSSIGLLWRYYLMERTTILAFVGAILAGFLSRCSRLALLA